MFGMLCLDTSNLTLLASMNWLDIIFPHRCALCRKFSEPICSNCLLQLPAAPSTPGHILSLWHYRDDRVRKIIYRLKRYRNERLAASLAPLLAHLLDEEQPELELFGHWHNPLLVPVPLHPKRLRERGFNQSELLARALARHTRIPYQPGVFTRVATGMKQALTSNRTERKINAEKSFSLQKNRDVAGRTIIIVDDVTTTGATLEALRQLLLAAGARYVIGITVAH